MIDASNLPKIAAVTAIVAFGVYRRVRRNIGRQILTATRQYVRMGLLSVLCLVLAFAHPLQPIAVAYIGSGLIVGRDLFADVIGSVAEQSGRPIQILDQRGQAPDHPISASCLETEYLKCLICRVGG